MIRAALRANLIPAILLWLFALMMLALYFGFAPARGVFEAIAASKLRLGLAFSMPAQAIAGGLMPFLLQHLQAGSHRKTRAAHLPYLLAFWACQGAITDVFYVQQARLWGDSASLATVFLKTAFDLLIVTPLFFMPLAVWAFAFKDCDFSLSKTRVFMGQNWWFGRVFPVYLTGLLVWTPPVIALYFLPLPLQFPIQSLVQCLWGLILVVLTARK